MTLPPQLARIVEAEYPRFSEQEMMRRRAAVEALLTQAGCDHLVFCGASRFGSAVQWLTQWPVTAEAVGVLTPRERDTLFVQYVNHAPQASILADKADVAWGGESSIAAAIKTLDRRSARADHIATLGPMTADQHAALSAKFGRLKSLNRDYVHLRQVKSPEELDWLRIGAHFSDLGMAALRDGLKPGLNERELGDLVERAYISYGATNVIHYIGVTSMQTPDLGVPRQFPRMRRVQSGDVVVAEISAAFCIIPVRCCAVSRSASQTSSTATCTRRRMPPSMRLRRSSRLARLRRRSSKHLASSKMPASRSSTIFCTATEGAICRPFLAPKAVQRARCRVICSAAGRQS